MTLILGIDEAGRGPVIGPLIIAGVLLAKGQLAELEQLGVRDSKRLSRARRAALAPEIRKLACQVLIRRLTPAQLDRENITTAELRAIAELIAAVDCRPNVILLDAPVPPRAIQAYRRRLLERLPSRSCEPKIIIENKADVRYPVVSAASIIAKVERDRAILELHKEYGDFGWGYPGEAKTRRFLWDYYRQHGELPDCVRRKWSTVERVLRSDSELARAQDRDCQPEAEKRGEAIAEKSEER